MLKLVLKLAVRSCAAQINLVEFRFQTNLGNSKAHNVHKIFNVSFIA